MQNATTLASYMSVLGMYEMRKDILYNVNDERVNKNLFSWK